MFQKLFCCTVLVVMTLLAIACQTAEKRPPNIVLFFIDDMGYGDIGPFGSANRTPNLDQMAAEGLKLTQFYVSANNCTPSRAALMTGSYADRIGMEGRVVFPADPRGLHPNEITIAEMLTSQGYATGCFGKWHLGDQPEFLPPVQGFDEYFGIPYSNDMWHKHPRAGYPPLPVMHGNRAVAWVSDGVDQALLSEAITDQAIEFIARHRNEPFFLYLPNSFVHAPRWVRREVFEKAGRDINRATVEEVDASVGRVLDALREADLADTTLAFFTSDNGGARGMDMGPLRGGKGDPKYEGAMRMPTLVWWPGRIPAGPVSAEIAATVDLLPTFARLAGAPIPEDRIIDGKDVLPVILGESGAKSPHEILYYEFDGIRRGKWKLVLPSPDTAELFDLEEDLGERNDLSAEHPEVVAELKALLSAHESRVKEDARSAGKVDHPKPLLESSDGVPTLAEYMGRSGITATNGSEEVTR